MSSLNRIQTGLFALASLSAFIYMSNAFQPPIIRSQRDFKSTSYSATIQEEFLTKSDEEILFGDDAHPPFPASHRKKSRTGNILIDKSAPISDLDYSPSNPLINKLRTVRDTLTNCPQLWGELSKHCPNMRALLDEHLCDETVDVTFSQMNDLVRKSAAVFANLGVTKGVNVAVLGENSARWLIADHGIQLAGGASAVRGADAPLDELRYIYEHSDSKGIAVLQGPRLLNKLAKDAEAKGIAGIGLSNSSHGPVKTVILIHREKKTNEEISKIALSFNLRIHVLADLLEATNPIEDGRIPEVGMDDLATIVYTSGTTGRPKGVMLTHGNLLHQIGHRLGPSIPYEESEPLPGETMVSLLPVWHITERTFELWMASRGCNVVYSSIRTFKNDLAKHKPQWLVLVPRVMEKIAMGVQDKFSSGSAAVKILSKLFTATSSARFNHKKIANGLVVGDEPSNGLERLRSKAIVKLLAPLNAVGDKIVWSKVKDGFGGQLKVMIAGGSALAGSLESFYETAGLPVLVGYGLTECSPLIAFRRRDNNLVTAGCAGKAPYDTELKVVDTDSKPGDTERKALPDGTAGVVLARGPQVTKGYYKDPESTAKAIDRFGWFDTGDVGRINPATGDLILTGRAKDTIVLSNGENIEPGPIEDALMGESPLIEQVMLVGQDGRRLVAIAVLSPQELVNAGFLDERLGKKLQAANEKVNDPKCTEEDCREGCRFLNEEGEKLRGNADLQKALKDASRKATSSFRPWEQVSEIYVTLEPFAMANGQLTQSYKVKRASVTERYADSLQ